MNARRLWAALLLAAAGGMLVPPGWPALAQPPSPAVPAGPPSASASPGTMRFRRVYTPLDRLKDWRPGGGRYVPMDASEFERLVGSAREPASEAAASVRQAVTAARYVGRLVGEATLEGEAVLDVSRLAEGPALVPLSPCGLAISEASWVGERRQAASLGLAPDGRLALLVDRSGQIELKWSLRGKPAASGGVDFPLELPPCPATSLVLDLPRGLTPMLERGVKTADSSGGDPARWRLDLGGHHRQQLRLVRAEHLDGRQGRNGVRQLLVYEASLRGLDVAAQWTLDVADAPLREMVVELDPELHLVTARLGDVPLGWSRMPARAGSGRGRVLIEFPEPIQGTGRVLRLGALGPVELGRRWRLPGLQPEDTFWQEGTATLVVQAPMVLAELATIRARQTAAAPLPGPGVGESVEVQYFAPDAAIEVVLDRPESPLLVDYGTSLELDGVATTARVMAKLHAADGQHFQVEADVGKLWAIDSVETIPANVLGDWTFEEAKGGGGKLSVRLAKAVGPSRPARLVVVARHLPSPLGRVFPAGDLMPLRFHAPSGGRRLVWLRAAGPYQLRLAGAERLSRVAPQSLKPDELDLLPEPPRGLLFESDADAASLQVALEPQKPSYSATIRVEATATDEGLAESYRVECVPESGRVDRLLVHFSHARPGPLTWTLGADDEQPLTARPWPASGQPPTAPAQGQTWEVSLRRPRTAAFEVRATRQGPASGPVPLSLASLPEAGSQRGTVVIASTGSTPLRVENHRLTPTAPDPVPRDQYSTTRATFRYDPPRDAAASSQPALVLLLGGTDGLASAWVWSADLQSRFEPSGTAHHLATYRLENLGREGLELALPPPLTLESVRSVWVDGLRAAWQPVAGAPGPRLRVALPQGRRFPAVSIRLMASGPPLGIISRVEPAMPATDVPVVAASWTAWLAPGYVRSAEGATSADLSCEPTASLVGRLFGLLARPEAERRFNPLAFRDWPWLDSDRVLALQQAGALLARLGGAESPVPPAGPAADELEAKPGNSGSMEQLAWAAAAEKLTLLVDASAIASARIAWRTPLAAPPADSAEDRGSAMLQRAGLALLLCEDVVLLTTELEAALHRSQLAPAEIGGVWRVLPGPLAERLVRAGTIQSDPALPTADAWRQRPEEFPSLWPSVDLAGGGPSDALGWTACRMQWPGGEPIRLAIFHRSTTRAFGWAAFLATLAIGLGRGLGRPGLLGVLAGLAAAVAMVVPEPYAPVASGALLALLAALLARLLGRGRVTAVAPHAAGPAGAAGSSIPGAAGAGIAGPLLLAFALLVSGRVVQAAVPAAVPAAAAPEAPARPAVVHEVFIPIDEKQQPTGEKYYVPEALYGRLQQMAAARATDLQGWQLTAATYRGSLSRQTAADELVLGDLRVGIDLEVFARKARVRIPLAHDGVRLLPGGVLLDGRPLQVDWPEGGKHLAFDLSEPGRYRLELGLRPIVQTGGGYATFQMGIPPTGVSRLELIVPESATAVEVPTALGSVRREESPPRIVAQLGPSDRLAVRWPQGTARGPGPAVEVDELLWLKIKPGSVVLDALLKLKVAGGQVQQLELAVDPRLRVLPPEGEASPMARLSPVPGRPASLRLELSRPRADAFAVPLSFLLTETSGIGSVRLPSLSVLDARVTSRWLAVSVDPELKHQEQGADRLPVLAVGGFLASWGEAPSPPTFARVLPSARPRWHLAVEPVALETTVASQALALVFGPRGVQVLLDARLAGKSGLRFQYRLAAPPELEVEHASLRDEGVERVARWSRGRDGRVTVFLSGPVAGKQELALRGRLKAPSAGSVALPVVCLEGAPKPLEIQIFREPARHVEIVRTSGLAEIEQPVIEEGRATLGRLVKALSAVGPAPPEAMLRLAPNRPRVRASQVTRLRSEGEGWEAEVEFQVRVSEGVVDEFHVDVPAALAGPYKVTPPAAVKVLESPGKGNRQLVIRPRTAVQGSCRLQVSGPLAFPPGERIGAVKVVLEQAEIDRHVLVLPLQSAARRLAWETRGLAAVPVPADLAALPEARDSLAAFQVLHEPFQALLKSAERAGGRPQVLLADVRMAAGAEGTCSGLATFDVDPADLTRCPLHLPAPYALVSVFLGGMPANPAAVGPGRWEIPLGPSRLPQRIEVVFTGPLPETTPSGRQELAAPWLGNLDVRETLWSVAAAAGLEAAGGSGQDRIGRLQQELHRLRAIAAVLEMGLEARIDEPEDFGRWYPTWARRWSASHDELRRQLAAAQGTQATQTAQADLETIERRQAVVAQRLGAGQAPAQPFAAAGPAQDAGELWPRFVPPSASAIRSASQGAATSIALVRRRALLEGIPDRLLVAAGLMMLSWLVVWAASRPLVKRLLDRWPQLVLAAVGLAWWLWLTPSGVGGGIVLAALLGAVVSRGRRRRAASRIARSPHFSTP